jgi:tetratricopeptide (TPR) repeat protein
VRVACVVLLLLVATPALAADDLFRQANQDFAAQRYQAAATKFEALLKDGLRNADLYYNLGNTYFRLAQAGEPNMVGRAILSYERALALDPGLEDARYNLEVAREIVAEKHGRDEVKDAAADPLWVRTVTWLSMPVLCWLFFAFDVLFFAVLVVVRFLSSGLLRTGLIAGNVFCGVAGLVLGVLLAGRIYFNESVQTGVVVADEVVMREGPDPLRREGPRLHAGHRAQVLETNHGWSRLRLANNYEGWVPGEAVEEVVK